MRTTSLLIAATAGIILVPAARADLLYYDSFDYPVQDGSGTAKTSSGNTLGQNIPWDPATPGNAGDPVAPWNIYYRGNSSPYVGSGSLAYPGLQLDTNPSSNDASFRGTGGSGDNYHWFNQPTTWDGSSQAPFTTYPQNPTTSTTLYYSMLLRVNQIGTVDGWDPGGSFPNGQFVTAFMDTTSVENQTSQANTSGALMIKSTDNSAFGTSYQLGIGDTVNTNSYFPTSGSYGLGQTVFVVVSYTMNPGTNTDVAKLYIDPTPGSLESANTAAVQTPAGSAETGALTGFVLKDDQHMPDHGLEIDELRIGTTWGDVTPEAFREPGDADLDGTVNSVDFAILAANYNKSGMTWNDGDFNGDGVVNALDFNILATNYGYPAIGGEPLAAPGSMVPEPSSMLLLLVSASGLLGRRRSSRNAHRATS